MAGVLSRLSAAAASPSNLLSAAARPSTHLSAAASPSSLLSAAAIPSTRLSAAARPSALLSAAARPSTRLRPTATAGQVRRLHGQVPSTPPELPSWVKDEVRKLVKEVVAEETRGMKEVCFERFDDVCSRLISISKDAAKLHAETMVMHIDTKKELMKIALRICVTMGGLAVATPLIQAGSSGDGGSPPSREEVIEIVKKEANTTREEIHKALKLELEVMAAKHFLDEEKRKESENNQP